MESTSKHFNLYDPAGMNYDMDRFADRAAILQHSEETKRQVLKCIAEVVVTIDKVKRISIARTDSVAAAHRRVVRRQSRKAQGLPPSQQMRTGAGLDCSFGSRLYFPGM